MDISYTTYGKKVYSSIEDYMSETLSSDSYGAVESALKSSEEGHKALGRLCSILADKNILSETDIQSVAGNYSPVEFIRD